MPGTKPGCSTHVLLNQLPDCQNRSVTVRYASNLNKGGPTIMVAQTPPGVPDSTMHGDGGFNSPGVQAHRVVRVQHAFGLHWLPRGRRRTPTGARVEARVDARWRSLQHGCRRTRSAAAATCLRRPKPHPAIGCRSRRLCSLLRRGSRGLCCRAAPGPVALVLTPGYGHHVRSHHLPPNNNPCVGDTRVLYTHSVCIMTHNQRRVSATPCSNKQHWGTLLSYVPELRHPTS